MPVVDDEGCYLGAALAGEVVSDAAGQDDQDLPRAVDLARRLPELGPDTSLHDALRALTEHDATGLPVVASPGDPPVGWIDHRDVLTSYAAADGHDRPGPP